MVCLRPRYGDALQARLSPRRILTKGHNAKVVDRLWPLYYAAFALRFIFPCAHRFFMSIDRRLRPAAEIRPRRLLLALGLGLRRAPSEAMPSIAAIAWLRRSRSVRS